MENRYPIYTEKTQCQDCYKCVRHCPVKAIRVREHSATVIQESCITCGRCVMVCPARAKKVRADLEKARRLVSGKTKVIASLAPSWRGEFPEVDSSSMVAAIRTLGFFGVSETALGAEIQSQSISAYLKESDKKLHISTACPAAVSMIQKHHPSLAENLTPFQSPVLSHARYLKEIYGEDTHIVFISPCIAKKNEADAHPDLIEVAITFQDLQDWFELDDIVPGEIFIDERDRFVPESAASGFHYPFDGGMNHTLKNEVTDESVVFLSYSGVGEIEKAIQNINPEALKKPVFLEILACDGGCINGPAGVSELSLIEKQLLISSQEPGAGVSHREAPDETKRPLKDNPVEAPSYSESELRAALCRVGKHEPSDELNCGGCGYASCRDFAKAILAEVAEPAMCVSYMRKLASKKANALIRSVPAGILIVDRNLHILECNEQFIKLIESHIPPEYKDRTSYEGCSLASITPFAPAFRDMFHSDSPTMEKRLQLESRTLKATLFWIEPHEVIGATFQDTAHPGFQREQIVAKTKEAIHKHLATVQKIAYLLGENAAETEILLNSVIESFVPENNEEE